MIRWYLIAFALSDPGSSKIERCPPTTDRTAHSFLGMPCWADITNKHHKRINRDKMNAHDCTSVMSTDGHDVDVWMDSLYWQRMAALSLWIWHDHRPSIPVHLGLRSRPLWSCAYTQSCHWSTLRRPPLTRSCSSAAYSDLYSWHNCGDQVYVSPNLFLSHISESLLAGAVAAERQDQRGHDSEERERIHPRACSE